MIDSYNSFSYGPFHVCYGELVSDSNKFTCRPDLLTLNASTKFDTPRRKASIRQFSQAGSSLQVMLFISFHKGSFCGQETIQLSFNMVVPMQEASRSIEFCEISIDF